MYSCSSGAAAAAVGPTRKLMICTWRRAAKCECHKLEWKESMHCWRDEDRGTIQSAIQCRCVRSVMKRKSESNRNEEKRRETKWAKAKWHCATRRPRGGHENKAQSCAAPRRAARCPREPRDAMRCYAIAFGAEPSGSEARIKSHGHHFSPLLSSPHLMLIWRSSDALLCNYLFRVESMNAMRCDAIMWCTSTAVCSTVQCTATVQYSRLQ